MYAEPGCPPEPPPDLDISLQLSSAQLSSAQPKPLGYSQCVIMASGQWTHCYNIGMQAHQDLNTVIRLESERGQSDIWLSESLTQFLLILTLLMFTDADVVILREKEMAICMIWWLRVCGMKVGKFPAVLPGLAHCQASQSNFKLTNSLFFSLNLQPSTWQTQSQQHYQEHYQHNITNTAAIKSAEFHMLIEFIMI